MRKKRVGLSKTFVAALIAGGITIIFSFIFHMYPALVESFYYKYIYNSFRVVWDLVFSWNPFPMFYIWLIILLIFFIIILRNIIFKQGRKIQSLQYIFILVAFHGIWFYWSWGFNYGRKTIGQRWELNEVVSEDLFLKEFYKQSKLVDSLRQSFKSEIDNYALLAIDLEHEMIKLVNQFHKENGFLVFPGVRCRELSLHGILLIWSTSGVYMPFAGESQIDGGLHKLSKPFTMAHELCHGMAWTHEGDCNFLAYLVCKKSNDPFIRYSGELNYWRYLYANASRVHPEIFKQVRSGLGMELLNDLVEINEANNRYPEIFPKLRSWFYDWYLKKHGIVEGDKSYSQIIRMVINYNRSD